MDLRRAWEYPSGAVADLARLAALLSAVVVVFSGRWEGALRFVLGFAALLLVRRWRIPRPFDALFGVALVVTLWANAAQWYRQAWWVDDVIHAVLPGLTAALLYLVLARFDVLPDLEDRALRGNRAGILVLALALGLGVAAVWEMYEWTVLALYPQASIRVGYDDTIADMALGGLSSLLAGLGLVVWSRSGRGTQRREPARARGHDRG